MGALPVIGETNRRTTLEFFRNLFAMSFEECFELNKVDDFRKPLAVRLALFCQRDAFGIGQPAVRCVPIQQGAVDTVFLELLERRGPIWPAASPMRARHDTSAVPDRVNSRATWSASSTESQHPEQA